METATPIISDKEKALKEEAAMAAHRKTIAEAKEAEAKAEKQAIEARKAEKDLNTPDVKVPDIKGAEGKFTVAGNFIETDILATQRFRVIMNDVAKEISKNAHFKNGDINLIIYQANDFADLELYAAFKGYLKSLKQTLENVVNTKHKTGMAEFAAAAVATVAVPVIRALTSLAGIGRSAADLWSLFRGDKEITNLEITAEQTLVISLFTESVAAHCDTCRVYAPESFPMNLLNSDSAESELLSLFQSAKKLQIEAVLMEQTMQNSLKPEKPGTQKSVNPENPAKDQDHTQNEQETDAFLKQLQVAISLFSQAESFLFGTDEKAGLSPIIRLLSAEKLFTFLRKSNSYVVKLAPKLNGSSVISKNGWRAKIEYSGGAKLSCLIFASDGSIVFANYQSGYTPLRKSNDIIPED